MWTELLRAMDAAAAASDPWTIERVAATMHALAPLVRPLDVEGDLPWGRYLVHADPGGRYNLQLDVFSRAYTGEVHAHGTWGIFWVLQGALVVTDCELRGRAIAVQRVARIGAGGAQCFCPPASDWHRVATPPAGPQTLSLHLYGPGFDLDEGVYFGEAGPTTYRRGPLGDAGRLRERLRERSA